MAGKFANEPTPWPWAAISYRQGELHVSLLLLDELRSRGPAEPEDFRQVIERDRQTLDVFLSGADRWTVRARELLGLSRTPVRWREEGF